MISDSGFQDEGTAEELYICNKSVLISDPKLAKILTSLSKRKREILMLSVYYGYSAEEIANKHGDSLFDQSKDAEGDTGKGKV